MNRPALESKPSESKPSESSAKKRYCEIAARRMQQEVLAL